MPSAHMSPRSVAQTALTNGNLPAEPFGHMDPTAVALIDLDGGLVARLPDEGSATPRCRDALVLVRLHTEPLAILYVERTLEELTASELAALVWARCEGEIKRHVVRASCIDPPGGPADLLSGVGGATACRSNETPPPLGSVAVIIPTRGRSSQLRRCLASVANLEGPECEVIVVNNGPPSAEMKCVVDAAIARAANPIRYVEEPRRGLPVARNRGIAETRADIVAFTDDDVVVDRDWLRWLIEPFNRPDIGAATGMVLPLELQTPAQKRFEQFAGFSKGLTRRLFDLRSGRVDHRFLYPFCPGAFGSGNSMAFRREALVAAGGFDPAFGGGSFAVSGEDSEALSAAILRGQRVVYEPRSLCWHEHRRGDEALRRQIFSYGVGFAAILTKALLHDRRFLAAAARSAPVAVSVARRRRLRARESAALLLPSEYARLQWQGMLRGPGRYARSVLWSRRLGLHRVIRGG
jgi:O-antigen biosynthesis protein